MKPISTHCLPLSKKITGLATWLRIWLGNFFQCLTGPFSLVSLIPIRWSRYSQVLLVSLIVAATQVIGATSANAGNELLPASNPGRLPVNNWVTAGPKLVGEGLTTFFANGTCTSGSLGGLVWYDYNSDGVRSSTLNEAIGISGVTVTVFSFSSNTALGTTTTGDNGIWSISGIATASYPVRVEFSNLPTYASSTFAGTNSKTTVQLVSAASCAVDLGIQNSADYCQTTDPPLAVTCFLNGAPTSTTAATSTNPVDVLVGFNYSSSSSTFVGKNMLAQKNEMGSVYGLAYDKKRKKLYAGAFLKRHVGLIEIASVPQLGTIYQVNSEGNTPVVSVLTSVTNVGTIATNAARGLGAPTSPSTDAQSFSLVGKIGLGDVEISDDMNTLFTVNLNTKQLVVMPLNAAGAVTSQTNYTIPSPCTTSRPFALKYYRDKLYVGVTCTLEGTATATSALASYVYVFDPATNTFDTTPLLTFPLNYARDPIYRVSASGTQYTGLWKPWSTNSYTGSYAVGGSLLAYPQPLLSDIEFDASGNMMLSLMDRWGHQIGYNNNDLSGVIRTSNGDGVTAGDIRKACLINGTYVIEGSAGCPQNSGGLTGSAADFFAGDFYLNPVSTTPFYHEEVTIGSMAYLPFKNEVAITAFDPVDNFYAGGLIFLNTTTTGAKSRTGIELYTFTSSTGGPIATFGKASGLGDLEAICNQAPKQIGNYIWIDTDRDGVQDANESGLNGVTVQLYRVTSPTSATLEATTTTATVNGVSGFYSFSAAQPVGTAGNLFTSLQDNAVYYVVVGNGQFNTTTQLLTLSATNYKLTTRDVGAGTQPDVNDSDGFIYTTTGAAFTNYPVTTITVGDAGFVNHTLDFGLQVDVPASISVTSTTVCYNNSSTLTATGCTGTVTWSNSTTATTLTTPLLTSTTSYTATCTTASGSTTFAVGTVTVLPQPLLSLSASATTVTAGTPISLSATGCSGTVAWSTGQSGSPITVTPTLTSQVYSATCTTGPACFTTASITITTAAPASISVNSATICYGSTATLSTSGCIGTVTWSNGTTGTSLTTGTLTSTTSYTATCTTSTGSTAVAVGTVTVSPQPILSLSASSTLVTAGTPVNLSATGCTGTVKWSTNQTGTSISVNPALATQVYSATCTTGPNCFTTASITIQTEAPTTIIVTSETVCYGSSASLMALGCSGTVSWSDGTSGSTLTISVATSTNSYTATCTTAASSTYAVGTVTVLPQPLLSLLASSLLVTSGNAVTLTASQCTGGITWSTGETGSVIVVNPSLASQTYSATCTTGPDCFTSASVTIQTQAPAMINVASTTVCYGTGATLTATGCVGTVSWSNGTVGSTLTTGLLTSTISYTATCTTSLGSTTSVVATVTVLDQPLLNLSASSTLVTTGNAVTLTASQCTGSVMWSTGETGSVIIVNPLLTTQTYSATCTTGPGCLTTVSITVNTQAPATIAVDNAAVCYGSTATLTATGCVGNVSWNTGATGASLSTGALTSTTSYTATCTTSQGSIAYAVGTVTVYGQPLLSLGASSTLVATDSDVTLTATQCTGTVTWSTGETGSVIVVNPALASQTYSATCTTGPACFTTASITIQTEPAPVISVNNAEVCYGSPATLTATGCVGAITWSDGTTGSTLTIPVATSTSSYTVTCTTATSSTYAVGTVVVLDEPLLSLSASSTLVTAGSSVTLTAAECTGYVVWSTSIFDTGVNQIVVNPSVSQTYSATCVTGPACFTSASVTVNTEAPSSIAVNSVTVCYGSPATLTATGCVGSVSWNTGATGASLSTGALTSTTSYTATCTTATSTTFGVGVVTVLDQPLLTLSASATLVTAGSAVTLTASQCTGGITWSTGETGSVIVVNPALASQTYSATCTTGPACSTTASISIATEAPATVAVNSVTVCYGSPATLTATGCVGSVSWNTGATGASLSTGALTSTTSYTATCTTATSTTFGVGVVTVLDQPLLTLSASATLVTAGSAVTLTASQCTGGITWSTGETGSVIVVNPALASQTYSATCTTGPACFTSASVTVNTEAPATVAVNSVTVCYGSPATLTATGCVGSVSWNTGATGASLSTGALTSTTSYTATCTTATSTTFGVGVVTVLDQPLLTLSASATLVTAGSAVTLTASQCTGGITWSTGETGSVIVVNPALASQTYSATCTTGPACFTSASVTVNTEAPATVAVNSVTVCYGSPATLTATGCVGSVSWNTGATGASLSTGALTSTTSYTATCTTATSTTFGVGVVTVLDQPLLTLSASATLVTAGSAVTLTASQCTGGITWSTGETGSVIVVNPALASQTYSATCTTGPACFTSASISIATEAPATVAVNSVTVCYGSPATLTATGCVGSVSWNTGATGASLSTGALTSTTSYTATCTTATSTTFGVGVVTVLDQPLLSLSVSSTLVTAGSAVTLTASQCTGGITWSTGETGSVIVVNPALASQTYSATCTTGPACSTTASISIATEAPATVAVNSVTVCYGSPATLTATGCVGSVSWNTGATGSTLTTAALTSTTSYTATCTTATSTTFGVGVVTVLDQPLLSLLASSTLVTAGSAVTLTASQCTGGITWSTGETGSVIVVNPALASQTYSATCTTGPACFTSASISIATEAPATVAVNSVTVCYGSPATLTATGCVGSVSWNTGATGASLSTGALTSTTSYTATCTTATSTTFGVGVVTVLDQPLLSLSASSTLVTAGSAVTLTASQCTGGITWSTGETGSVIVVNPSLASQTYSATCTTGPACFTSASVSIATEAPSSIAVNSVTVCYGSPATLTATGCVGSVSWNTGATGASLSTGALTTTTSYTATCTTATSTTFGVGVVTVLDQPLLSLSASSSLVTSGSAVTLTASQCTGGITWSTGETGSVIVVNPSLASQTYSATCTTGPACFTSASVSIATEAPSSIAVNSVTVCYGSPATLTATGCVGSVSWNTGATGASLSTGALTTTTSYTATCTTATSTTFGVGVVTVLDQPLLSLSASSSLVTSGSAVTLTASQCTGGITWSTGETGSVIVVNPALASQTYSATCTTGPACSTTASISIATEAPATVAVNSVTVCYGSPATLTATGCVGSVSWNTGATGSTLTTAALTSTTSYTATCTTATSTTFGVGVVTVLDQPLLTLSASATLVTSGSAVTLTASQCTGGLTWSTGETGSVIVVNPSLASQTYSATCTTGPACSTTASISIATEAPATVAVNSVTVCYGSPATLTATGCVGSVSWNTGATGSTLTTAALTSTTSYTATCTTATSTTFGVGVVTVLDQPLLSLSASSSLVTAGSAVTLTASQCTGGITWSTGETGSVIVVNPTSSQTYSATCTTGPACSTTASISIATEAPATVAVNSVTVCYGSPATLTATGCVGSVSWNTGATGASLSTGALTSTTSYTATCTTATSTTFGVGVVTVLDQPLLSLSASSTLVTAGSAVTLTASQCTGGITWSTGETGSVIVVNPALASQTYSATCTTGPACFTSASVTVNTEAPATVAVNSVTVCYGSPATLTATGCVGSVSWNTGATGSTLTTAALTSTTSYTATCTTATSTTFGVGVVTVLDQPLLSLSASSSLVTSGSAVTLTASQCTGGITWSTGETGSVIVVNPTSSQTFSATCTTGPACSTTASISIATEAPATVAVNSVTVCYGSPATLTATGCVGSVSWNTGATGASLSTGALTTTTSYTATCTTATSTTFGVGVVTVLDQPLLSLSASSSLVTSGSAVTLTASQCTGGITWSTGETGSVIVVNPTSSQTFSATCTTGPACSTTASISIATEAPATVAVNSVTVCYGSPATLTATGCVGSVSWNTGATGASLSTGALTTTTSYTATCTTATSTTFGVGVVTVLDQPLLSLSVSSTLVTAGSAVTLTASQCTGGITWSTGETGSVIVVNPALASQTYSATCTTGPACSTTASISIATEAPATVAVNSVTVCSGSPATLTATGCVGSVSWNTGATGSTLTTAALTSTTSYTATCTTATSTTFGVGVVTVLDQPLLSLSASSSLVTAGSAVTLTASQCTGGLTWSTGETGSVIVVNPSLASQTYSATCTTGPACFTTASITIQAEAPATVAVNSVTVCYGSPATLTATGCVGSVSWNTGATGASLSTGALTSTTSYTATCTTATSTTFGVGVVTVLDQPLLTLSASATLVTSGSAVTLTASQCTGGITWSTGETGSVIVVNPALASQTYSATCTTGPACFTSASVTIQTEVPLCVLTVTAAPGDCDTRTNTYIVMGTITSANGAAVQSLTVTDGLATTTVLLTGNGPVSFTLTGLTSDQATHLVTVASNATTCGVTSTTYTAPASCTVACPAPVTVCQGSQYAVQLDGPTGQLAYQWYRNGQAITGATGSSYTATQAGSYSLIVNNSDLCVGNSCCPRIIEEVAGVPSLTLVTQAPTCNKATSLTNGQLSITGLGSFETGNYTYQYVQGNVFNSATAQPAAAVSVPGNGLLLNTLLGGETITVRVYNVATGCYVDQTVLIPVANCECPPKVCLPLVISKIR